MDDLLRIAAVLGLVGANAFFVVGEYSVITARRTALRNRADAGSAGARVALRLMDDPVRVISTVQVGITAVGILVGALGEPLVRDVLGDALPGWAAFVLAFAIVTYLSVVLGELVPKALTLEHAEAIAALVARPVWIMSVALRPPVWVLEKSAAVLLRPFGIQEVIAGDTIRSADELKAVVDEVEGSGVIPEAQEELLHNVFDFPDHEARDVMVPAPDVAWLPASSPPGAAIDRMLADPHERYPVGRETLDRVVGVVHFLDVVRAEREQPDVTLEHLAREALVVPETKDIGALLREMREGRHQLAVVADEYGGTAGVVSLEDIVEELVGEIQDEFDLPDSSLEWVDDRTVLVAGSMTIDDFNEEVGTNLPKGGSRTLAGLTFDALGRRPQESDRADIDGVEMSVEEVDDLRITRLRIGLPARAADTGTAN